MERYDFHYRKTNIHLQLLLVFGLFALLLFYFSFQSFRKMYAATGADRQVFTWLALGMGLAGLAFLAFGLWYYFYIRRFFSSNEWYGVEVSSSMISCRSFDFIKKHYWEISIQEITAMKAGSYKGRRYLSLITANKTYTIPVNNMDSHDLANLTNQLQQLIAKQS